MLLVICGCFSPEEIFFIKSPIPLLLITFRRLSNFLTRFKDVSKILECTTGCPKTAPRKELRRFSLCIICLKTTSSVTWAYLPVRTSAELKKRLDSTDRHVRKSKGTRHRRMEDEYISNKAPDVWTGLKLAAEATRRLPRTRERRNLPVPFPSIPWRVLPYPCPDSVTRRHPVHTPIQAPGLPEVAPRRPRMIPQSFRRGVLISLHSAIANWANVRILFFKRKRF